MLCSGSVDKSENAGTKDKLKRWLLDFQESGL